MSAFWNLWAVILTLIFFVLMVSVVVKYWRSNHQADQDHTLGTFDGIEEKMRHRQNYSLLAMLLPFYCLLAIWCSTRAW